MFSFRAQQELYEGEKLTTASDMASMERQAIGDGDASGNEYMMQAAEGITRVLAEKFDSQSEPAHCTLLCAKGNNSGDAYSVGERLLDADIEVVAYQLFPKEECSELCQLHMNQYIEKGGVVVFLDSLEALSIPKNSLVLDGLLGTGFRGEVTGLMGEVIEKVNHSENQVVSIDIPSGVPGDTGIVSGPAVFADLTIYLGLLKVGHFFNDGYEHLGDITGVHFGISKKYVDALTPFGYLVNERILKQNIPRHKRTAHKYDVGQAVLIAGSPHMPGAAQLAASAALKSGAGIVKLYHPPKMEPILSSLPPEVIRTPYTADHMEEVDKELKRTKCLLVGPGLGQSAEVEKMLTHLHEVVTCPMVIDADALAYFKTTKVPAVLTPHRGEAIRLLKADKDIRDLDLIRASQQFAKEHNVVIVLKGAPTVVLSPNDPNVVIPAGNRGMASGGMGDALAGIITSLIAQGMDVRSGAILGALIHAAAGDCAKEIKSMHSMTATDLINCLTYIFQKANE